MQCKSRKTKECVYLTKENIKEFIKNNYPYLSYDTCIVKTDNYIKIYSPYGDFTFHYNYWYVNNGDTYPKWINYSEEEFNDEYELIITNSNNK